MTRPEVVAAVSHILSAHRGEAQAVTLERLTDLVRERLGSRVGRRAVEAAVSELARSTDLGVSSTPEGIFLAASVAELDRGLAYLTSHAVSILRRRSGLKRARARLLGQQRLPEPS